MAWSCWPFKGTNSNSAVIIVGNDYLHPFFHRFISPPNLWPLSSAAIGHATPPTPDVRLPRESAGPSRPASAFANCCAASTLAGDASDRRPAASVRVARAAPVGWAPPAPRRRQSWPNRRCPSFRAAPRCALATVSGDTTTARTRRSYVSDRICTVATLSSRSLRILTATPCMRLRSVRPSLRDASCLSSSSI